MALDGLAVPGRCLHFHGVRIAALQVEVGQLASVKHLDRSAARVGARRARLQREGNQRRQRIIRQDRLFGSRRRIAQVPEFRLRRHREAVVGHVDLDAAVLLPVIVLGHVLRRL